MSIASLVLGIVSIVVAVFGGPFSWIGIFLGAGGIVLACMAKKEEPNDNMAMGGLVCSIVGASISLVTWAACLACTAAFRGFIEEDALNEIAGKFN